MPVTIDGITFAPGTIQWTTIELARDADGSLIEVDICVVSGERDGPTLWMQGGIHGNEPGGTLAAREFVRELDPADVRGTVVAVPVANPVGFTERQRGTVSHLDSADVNAAFPGDSDGSFPQQCAHALFTAVNENADYFVDLHSADEKTVMHEAFAFLPATGGETQRVARRLASLSGVPHVAELAPDELAGFAVRELADAGIPSFVLESGGGSRVFDWAMDYYRDGLRNVAREVGILPGSADAGDAPSVHDAIVFCFAHDGGFADIGVRGGDIVSEGDHLATTTDVRGETVETVTAPADAVVLAVRSNPTARPGDLLVELAPQESAPGAANRPG